MTKRPKDMTPSELAALPVGPIVITTRPARPECGEMGRVFSTATWKAEALAHFEPDDLVGAVIDGASYTFGQWADGTWFRRPM